MSYALHLLIVFDIWAILAIGLNLLAGRLGIVTMAHASYFALGGYAYAITAKAWAWPFPAALALAIGLATASSLAVSLAAWRLKRDFLVLATLSLQVTTYYVLRLWTDPDSAIGTWRNLTNGTSGIAGIPVSWAETPGRTQVLFAILATAFLAGALVLTSVLLASPWGRRAAALRDDELALRGLGKDPRPTKVEAAMLACGLAGAAGGLYAAYAGYLDPSSGSLDQSILMLATVVLGGLGTTRGALAGALVVVGLPEILRSLSLPEAQAAPLRLMIFGALLVVLIHWRPGGLLGRYRWV